LENLKRPRGRHRRRWRTILEWKKKETEWKGVDWMHVTQGSDQKPYEYDNEPSGSTKGGEFLDQRSDYLLL
jgi:hypothetical protein